MKESPSLKIINFSPLLYFTIPWCICTAGEFIKFHDVLECTYLQQLSKIMIVMLDGFAKKILNGWLHTNLLTVEMILFPKKNSWKSSMLKWLNYQKIAQTSFQFWLGFHKKKQWLDLISHFGHLHISVVAKECISSKSKTTGFT